MERVALYLRKSRADLDAESRGEGETLAKHRNILLKAATDLKLTIIRIREEIVSGESLIYRPEMLELLREVESGCYDAVLVMDIDRLGRGDMIDQGTIQRAFKQSGTKIITPRKIYNLDDEWDEEYSEFEAFMARKELKIINRRLQRGRIASVKEGNYIANTPPYGYRITTLQDGSLSLEPHPEQAAIVVMIFNWYTKGVYCTESAQYKQIGASLIARKLNEELCIPTMKSSKWIASTILGIVSNPVYIGSIRWNARPTKMKKGSTAAARPRTPRSEWILAEGKHPAIIEEHVYKNAQLIMSGKRHIPAPKGRLSNPLAGLARCDMCQGPMIYRSYPGDRPSSLICTVSGCSNVSSYYYLVEEKLLQALRQWLQTYKAEWSQRKPDKISSEAEAIRIKKKALAGIEKQLEDMHKQKEHLYDLLERKVYGEDLFMERFNYISSKIEQFSARCEKTRQALSFEEITARKTIEVIPNIEYVLETYTKTRDAAKKNALLKSVLERISYRKEQGGRWNGPIDQFELTLYPKLPQY